MPNLSSTLRLHLADAAPPSERDLAADPCNEAVVLIDADRRIIGWSRGAEQLLGYSANEAVGQSIDLLSTPEDRADGRACQELELASKLGESAFARWYQRRDGARFIGSGTVMAIHNGDGSTQGFVKVLHDVHRQDELGRLLEQAAEGNRLKDEVLSTVSHELRMPLNAILGWIQLLHLGKATPERVEQALDVIERNALVQARLIDDLLDMSRILGGKTRLNLAEVSLAVPLGAAIETIRPVATQKGLTLTLDTIARDDVVFADAGRLQQVISNVLANAVKFTRAGGTIAVSTARDGTMVEVRIRDSGIGIDPSFVPFVFDRFRQADDAPTREQGGLGLGLSIVKHLVELHGGRVSLKSDGCDRGTTVILCLPVVVDKSVSPAHLSASTPSRTCSLLGRNVLIVDDDADGSEMLEVALAAYGAHVRRAQSVSAAVEAVHQETPHIVLTDLSMPGADGFALLAELRKNREATAAALRIVAITGYARDEDKRRCLAAGFDDYVAKPIDLPQIIDLVAATSRAGPAPSSLDDGA